MSKVQFYSVMFVVLFAVLILVEVGCSNSKEEKVLSQEEMVQKGKYLVNLGGCNDCHSPKVMTAMGPVPDTTRLLSGNPQDQPVTEIDPAFLNSKSWLFTSMNLTAWVGPWGVSYTANLTPDAETGLGNWTPDLFIKALRSGKHMGVGRPILPPMPWPAFAQLNDEDLKCIFAYLHSLPAVHNKVPDPLSPDMMASLVNKDNMNMVKAKDTK